MSRFGTNFWPQPQDREALAPLEAPISAMCDTERPGRRGFLVIAPGCWRVLHGFATWIFSTAVLLGDVWPCFFLLIAFRRHEEGESWEFDTRKHPEHQASASSNLRSWTYASSAWANRFRRLGFRLLGVLSDWFGFAVWGLDIWLWVKKKTPRDHRWLRLLLLLPIISCFRYTFLTHSHIMNIRLLSVKSRVLKAFYRTKSGPYRPLLLIHNIQLRYKYHGTFTIAITYTISCLLAHSSFQLFHLLILSANCLTVIMKPPQKGLKHMVAFNQIKGLQTRMASVSQRSRRLGDLQDEQNPEDFKLPEEWRLMGWRKTGGGVVEEDWVYNYKIV